MWKSDHYHHCLTITQRRAQVEIKIEQKHVTDVKPDPPQFTVLTGEDACILGAILMEYGAKAKAYYAKWGEAGN